MKKIIFKVIALLLIPLSFFSVEKVSGNNEVVYVADIEGEITLGLAAYVERAIETAEENDASAIIFKLDTPGGAVNAAEKIGQHLTNTDLKTIAFVNPDAISAGAYIAINMDEIYMTPKGAMGAATAITSDGNAAEDKVQSYWISKMRSAAELNGRDPIFAEAMVDKTVHLPEYGAKSGDLLTFTANQAIQAGYSEGIVENQAQLLNEVGFSNVDLRHVDVSWSERIADFVTNSVIIPILLSLGSLGLVLELYSPGFGAPGIVGISSLLLFFYGHLIAGLAGMESIILFIIGFILIVLELFVPGGIAGFIGLGSIILSILIAGESMVQMAISLLIAFIIAIIAMVILMKFFGKKIRVISKLVLKDSTNTEQGYVSNKTRTELLNREGITMTPLRPSGTIMIDKERIDAVTEGGFINPGAKVMVVKVEGVRVIVREINE